MSAIKNRYEFVILFDVENGNPNGDPDAGNMPRMDIETRKGIVTNNCLKRKIRNYIDLVGAGAAGKRIYISSQHSLNSCDFEAFESVGVEIPEDPKKVGEAIKAAKKDNPDLSKAARDFMCQNFYDIRTFGAVLTTFSKGALNGQITGPVQLCDARSVDPILPQELTITRVAITTEADRAEKNSEMGGKYIVPYGLYRCDGFISAHLAQHVTGFSEEDLELLWEAILNMFEHDRSAVRGKMAVRELIVFKHDSALGNARSHELLDLIRVEKKQGVSVPRTYSDYTVDVDLANLPAGVTCKRLG